MIEIKFVKGATEPYLCYNFDKNRWHLELPTEYFDDEDRLSDIVKRASEEVARREAKERIA